MYAWIYGVDGRKIKRIRLEDTPFKSGGEGSIHRIYGTEEICAKIYREKFRTKEREMKISAMIINKPKDPMRSAGHISLAWPEHLLFKDGKFIGFTMPFIKNSVTISKVYSKDERLKKVPWIDFNWYYLLITARNLVSAVAALHEKGHAIGDVNESNVLVSPKAIVTLIDCDSYIIQDKNRVYDSNVGREEYAPPEVLRRGSYEGRGWESDMFAIPILIFKLLMLGFHPFSGRWRGAGEPPSLSEKIVKGLTPYFRKLGIMEPPPRAPPLKILPQELYQLFYRAFVEGHSSPHERPTAKEWFKVLDSLRIELEKEGGNCWNPNHKYLRLKKCPWCEYVQKWGPENDPFPPPTEVILKRMKFLLKYS